MSFLINNENAMKIITQSLFNSSSQTKTLIIKILIHHLKFYNDESFLMRVLNAFDTFKTYAHETHRFQVRILYKQNTNYYKAVKFGQKTRIVVY
jgi:hypothetical protein